ncbi:MAG: NAD(P)-dependent oxidoreductase [Anaerolineae bacterium]|nr:NAD(P)-dependent oxidoreductase [Anaerolineae bacterium]
MKVLITGGSGHIGSFAVAHLLARGYNVRIIDRTPAETIPPDVAERIRGAEYVQVDITDYQATRVQVAGIDAVAHLAAIPHPIPGKDAEIFHINCGGSFNVYQAAADAGIKRVVSASSINALGNGYGIRNVDVKYFPIDEEHPGWTTDIYSFSKQLLEETAAYFWRRNEISGACLRFPFVYNPEWFVYRPGPGEPEPDRAAFRQRMLADFDAVMALPEAQRREQMASMMARLADLRDRQLKGEIDHEDARKEFQSIPCAMFAFGRNDFWTNLDVRDAAQAIEKALVAGYESSHPLWVVNTHNTMGLPSRELAALMYPDVKTWKRPVPGDESLISIDKARAMIGFEPEYSHNFAA